MPLSAVSYFNATLRISCHQLVHEGPHETPDTGGIHAHHVPERNWLSIYVLNSREHMSSQNSASTIHKPTAPHEPLRWCIWVPRWYAIEGTTNNNFDDAALLVVNTGMCVSRVDGLTASLTTPSRWRLLRYSEPVGSFNMRRNKN